ncbi:MAG TPA: hypothetical protein VLX60_13510 [Terriglobales bacterium]|nr:hypothetical protein [Terriglobales bacterium]
MKAKLPSLRTVFVCLAMSVAFLFAGVTAIHADDDCQKRIIKADRKLHEEAAKHGWESSQAEHWRHELADARAYCWDHYHRWWDEDAHRWHDQRDWDEHDHDRH